MGPAMEWVGRSWRVLRDAGKRLAEDDASLLAGAISFFTFLSLLPTLLFAILTVGWVLGRERATAEVVRAGEALLGPEGRDALDALLANPSIGEGSIWVATGSIIAALYGGSRAFFQLQLALNRAYRVRTRPRSSWRGRATLVVKKRGISVLIMLGVGAAILLSVIARTVLSVIALFATSLLGEFTLIWTLLQLVLSTSIIAVFLGVVYRVLPDVVVDRRDVVVGAVVAALLLALGANLLSFYLTTVAAHSLSGAAATFVVTLLWLYFMAYAVLYGAEVTATVAQRRGRPLEPEPHAEKMRAPEPVSSEPVGGAARGPAPHASVAGQEENRC